MGSRSTTSRVATLWIFRVVSTLMFVGLAAQPVLAGAFLSGNYPALQLHGTVGGVLFLPALVQVVAAALLWRPGRVSYWVLPLAVAMIVAISLQLGFGYSRALAVHIPLGVSLVVCSAMLVVWVWRTPAVVRRVP